jgi:hypothetical protein
MPINFADISTNQNTEGGQDGFAAIPEGRYTVLVEEAKPGISQTGNEKLSATFVILDEGSFKGRKLWHDFSAAPKAQVFMKYFLEAVKSNIAQSKNATLKDVAIDVKNKKCTVYVEQGVTNNGNPRNILSKFKPLDGDPLATETPVSETPVKGEAKKSLFN